MLNKICVIRLNSSSVKMCFLLKQVVNAYYVWPDLYSLITDLSSVSLRMPIQHDTWCCIGMTICCNEALLTKVFTSIIVKVKLLLNAAEGCYYIMLWDSMQGVARKYTTGFLLLPTTTRETVAFFFLWLPLSSFACNTFSADKQNWARGFPFLNVIPYFSFFYWFLVGTPKIHTGNVTRKGRIKPSEC